MAFDFRDFLSPHHPGVPVQKSHIWPPEFLESMHLTTSVKWDGEACDKLKNVPFRYLRQVVIGVAKEAESQGLTTVTADFIDGTYQQHRTRLGNGGDTK